MAVQHVALLYAAPPEFDLGKITSRAAELTGQPIEAQGNSEPLVLVHRGAMAPSDGGGVPAQTVIVGSDRPQPIGDYTDLIQQSWATEDAADLVARATCEIKVLELMTRPLDPGARMTILHAVVRAVTEATEPLALAFEHSQQILQPGDALAEWRADPEARPGCINVRYFNPGDGSQLMDTRGLEELGLPDLQCHFKVLDPGPVAHLLTTIAHYLIEHGPVIDSGHTVAGIEEGQTWTCRFEECLVQPRRTVLDLDPGPEFAAGKRSAPGGE